MGQRLINENSKRYGGNFFAYKSINEIEPIWLNRVVVNLFHSFSRNWTWKLLEQSSRIEVGGEPKLDFVLDTHDAQSLFLMAPSHGLDRNVVDTIVKFAQRAQVRFCTVNTALDGYEMLIPVIGPGLTPNEGWHCVVRCTFDCQLTFANGTLRVASKQVAIRSFFADLAFGPSADLRDEDLVRHCPGIE